LKDLWQRLFVALQYLLPHHALSRLVGILARSETPWVKDTFIRLFIRRFQVDLSEAEITEAERYPHFNAFFTRALREGARPLPEQADAIACPADGTVSQLGAIEGDRIFQAKGHNYSLFELLGGDHDLATEFLGGQFATVYLSPKDYHRVHMPAAGTLRETRYVPGRLFSVNQATTERVPGLFARNERLVCIFDTEQGPMAVILVGAMIVAGIETVFSGQVTPLPRHVTHSDYRNRQPITLQRGEELGRFLLGSTAIVLFARGHAEFDAALAAESPVRMGQAMGTLR